MEEIKILFITTSHDKLGDTGRSTGLWLEEIAAPYYLFSEAGVRMTLASPLGGQVPLDPKSESIMMATSKTKKFLNDPEAMQILDSSIRLDQVDALDYDGVYIPGGHGPLWDLSDNKLLKKILEGFLQDQKPVAAVCHGVVALLNLEDENGAPLLKGKQVTGFSNSEESSAGLTAIVPLLVEASLVSLGAEYSKGPDFESYVIIDGNILTGQNPASSGPLAKQLMQKLAKTNTIKPVIPVTN